MRGFNFRINKIPERLEKVGRVVGGGYHLPRKGGAAPGRGGHDYHISNLGRILGEQTLLDESDIGLCKFCKVKYLNGCNVLKIPLSDSNKFCY